MEWIKSIKSEVIGCCGGDKKKRITTQNRQKSNAKKKKLKKCKTKKTLINYLLTYMLSMY